MISENNQRIRRQFRIAGLLLGVLFLIWLPIEDLNEGWVIAYAAMLCSWGAARYLYTLRVGSEKNWIHFLITGGFAGLFITPATLLLMAFKTGLHAHEAPDFTPHQMARVVELTPVWVLAGLFTGLGAGLWKTARSK